MAEIIVFVRGNENVLLPNSKISVFVGDRLLGFNEKSDGRASFTIDGTDQPMRVRAEYVGFDPQEATLAADQQTVTFLFPVDVRNRWVAFFKENFPALLGFVMLVIALALAFTFRDSTPTQDVLLRITISLAAGGIATILSGSIGIKLNLGSKLAVTAAGAFAVFALTYLVHPDIIIRADANVTAPADNGSGPAGNDADPANNMS